MNTSDIDFKNPLFKYLYLLSYFSQYVKNSNKNYTNGAGKGYNFLSCVDNSKNEIEYIDNASVLDKLNSKNKEENEQGKKFALKKISEELNLDLSKEFNIDNIFNEANKILNSFDKVFKNKISLVFYIEKIYKYMIDS